MKDNIISAIEKYKLAVGLLFLGIVLIIGGILSSNPKEENKNQYPQGSLIKEAKKISIDVSGAVLNPGVYTLLEGARIEDAVLAAGGFASDANLEYISKYLNMAQKLVDGSKVYVPKKGEQSVSQSSVGVLGESVESKININTSTQSKLEELPSVGPATALKIISNRPYQTIDELLSKKAVGKAVFEKIKDLVVLY